MKITLAELMVILDTLRNSTNIVDRGGLFGYTDETRKQLAEVLTERMNNVTLDIKLSSNNSGP